MYIYVYIYIDVYLSLYIYIYIYIYVYIYIYRERERYTHMHIHMYEIVAVRMLLAVLLCFLFCSACLQKSNLGKWAQTLGYANSQRAFRSANAQRFWDSRPSTWKFAN